MLVKAKWNVKDASGWHDAGDVFETSDDLGDAVEVLDAPRATVKATEVVMAVNQEASEKVQEPAKKETSVRATSSRRKAANR